MRASPVGMWPNSTPMCWPPRRVCEAMAHMGSSVKRFVSDAVWARGMQRDQRRPGAGRGRGRDHAGPDDRGHEARVAAGPTCARGRLARDAVVAGAELFGREVGIIGASNVGRHVIKLLGRRSLSRSWSTIPSSRRTRRPCWACRRSSWMNCCGGPTSSRCTRRQRPTRTTCSTPSGWP